MNRFAIMASPSADGNSQAAEASPGEQPRPELFFVTLDPPSPADSPGPSADFETIVFLHGLLGSHLEWLPVASHIHRLSSGGDRRYRLLIPDLPGHSRSSTPSHLSSPTTISRAAADVADLIRRHVPARRAYLVGLSMGGFVALEVARAHPDVVLGSVFVTGAAPFVGSYVWLASHPAVVWWMMQALVWMPAPIYNLLARWRGLIKHDELRTEMAENAARWEVVRDVYGSILELDLARVGELAENGRDKGFRVLSVASGLQDQVESTREMGREMRRFHPGHRAVVVRRALHAWDLQFPELFARGILAWIEGHPLPPEFEELA